MTLLDVRDRTEIERWRIEAPSITAHHVPYMRFVAAGVTGGVADLLPADVREPVVAVCPHGEASAEVADQLVATGIDAENLAGGMDAWARLYDRIEIAGDADATLYQYRRPASGCLGYAVVADGEMAVIDPLRAFADRYVDDAAELGATLTHAVDTHVHADHVSGVRAVAERTDAEVVLPAGAADRGLAVDATLVDDDERLPLGETALRALRAPGHTREMTAFVVGGSGRGQGTADGADVLLTGDSLFLRSVARPDLEDGVDGAPELAALLHGTLTERFANLSDDVVVAPGHHDAATTAAESGAYAARLGDLRASVAALSMDADAFVDHVLSAMPPRPNNYQRIIATNLGREHVDDREAFEMELGPNNCAAAGADAD